MNFPNVKSGNGARGDESNGKLDNLNQVSNNKNWTRKRYEFKRKGSKFNLFIIKSIKLNRKSNPQNHNLLFPDFKFIKNNLLDISEFSSTYLRCMVVGCLYI